MATASAALVPATPAAGDAPNAAPKSFRIGPEINQYIYTEHEDIIDAVHQLPVYQCSRDIDQEESMRKCLWLFKTEDGYWQANSAPRDSRDPIKEGSPIFRSYEPNVDVREPGVHAWTSHDRGAFRNHMNFETTVLS
jgi:hypothetical protein